MVVFPNAKINLGLNVLRKRKDGYHDISTVMIGVDWCDVLEIIPNGSSKNVVNLITTGISINCADEDNIIVKAVNAVRKAFPDLPGVDIYLHKNIPDGAGLGGGSSDASFTVMTLNRVFELGMTPDQMAAIAAEIGCDCPFFIYNVPSVATYRGDVIEPLIYVPEQLNHMNVVIVKPKDVFVPTSQAYASIIPVMPICDIEGILKNEISTWRESLANDFELTVFPHHPVLGKIKNCLYEIGASYASMSGSGSAVYGLFYDANRDEVMSAISRQINMNDYYCHFGKLIL